MVYCHYSEWGLTKYIIIQNICTLINKEHNAASTVYPETYQIQQRDCLIFASVPSGKTTCWSLDILHWWSGMWKKSIKKQNKTKQIHKDIKLGRHHLYAPGSYINNIRNSWQKLKTIQKRSTIPIELNWRLKWISSTTRNSWTFKLTLMSKIAIYATKLQDKLLKIKQRDVEMYDRSGIALCDTAEAVLCALQGCTS